MQRPGVKNRLKRLQSSAEIEKVEWDGKKSRGNGLFAIDDGFCGLGRLGGGRIRDRTWDPMIKSRLLVYNTFPLPMSLEDHTAPLEYHAWDIVAAREAHPGKTIAWLYGPDTMPKRLLDAHQALDNTLEKLYIGRPFKNDTDRLEHLFKLYAEMTAGKLKEVVNA
jgi:hypothetical protein